MGRRRCCCWWWGVGGADGGTSPRHVCFFFGRLGGEQWISLIEGGEGDLSRRTAGRQRASHPPCPGLFRPGPSMYTHSAINWHGPRLKYLPGTYKQKNQKGGEEVGARKQKIIINLCPDGFCNTVGHRCITVTVSVKVKKKKTATIGNNQVVVLIVSRLFDESNTKAAFLVKLNVSQNVNICHTHTHIHVLPMRVGLQYCDFFDFVLKLK